MKYSKFFIILLLGSVISLCACNDKSDARKQKARESLGVSETATQPNVVTPPPPTTEPAQNAEGVWHYTCAKGCAGGAGAAGTCATCGGQLAHNSAYHSTTNSTATATNPITTNPITSPTTPPIPPPTTEPAQNAAGVWHYTCSKGCAGGAGAVGPCGTCGGTLAHNAAYHQ